MRHQSPQPKNMKRIISLLLTLIVLVSASAHPDGAPLTHYTPVATALTPVAIAPAPTPVAFAPAPAPVAFAPAPTPIVVAPEPMSPMGIYFGDEPNSPSFWATVSSSRNYPHAHNAYAPLPYQLPADPKHTKAPVNPQGRTYGLVANTAQQPTAQQPTAPRLDQHYGREEREELPTEVILDHADNLIELQDKLQRLSKKMPFN
jgi:hypothetical protein